jgi:hypothetical protein
MEVAKLTSIERGVRSVNGPESNVESGGWKADGKK